MYPKKISPSPLVSSTVEIRFKSDKDTSGLLTSLLPEISKKLGKIESTSLPREVRLKTPELKYYPEYIFSNDDYSLSCNESFVSFENITEYKLWNNYSSFLKDIIGIVFESGIIQEIERVGVRYQSEFSGKKFKEIFKESPTYGLAGFEEDFLKYMTKIKSEDFNIILRLKKGIHDNNLEENVEDSHKIDIDVFLNENLKLDELINKIDSAHGVLKKLFFDLLTEEFVQNLNPEY